MQDIAHMKRNRRLQELPLRHGRKHLYSESAKHSFEKRYGKEHGDEVWRETVGKVKREREAKKADPPPRRRRRSPSVFDAEYWTG